MERSVWQRVESALHDALDLAPEERAEFVAAIADPEIRAEVESLLAVDGEGLDRSLEQAISGTASRAVEDQERYQPGSQFRQYRLLELLGTGGMSRVFLAEDQQLGRKVALKFLPVAFSEDMGRVRRFEREARAAAALNHPNIVTIYEIGNEDGLWFIALEYVLGEPLDARISRGPIPVLEALSIVEQVAAALNETHRGGILHRDIKPANIMLREDGLVKLIDFGIARVDPVIFEGGHTTLTGRLLGTPAYMSPEQAKGLSLSASSDLWSLGAVLYEMVTGTRAFRGSDNPDVLVAILSRKPQLPSKKIATIPPALDLLIMKLLSQNPAARPSSTADVIAATQAIRLELTAGPVRKTWSRLTSLFR